MTEAAGRDSVLLAPTNDLVAELNDRARADRLRSNGKPPGRTVELSDGLPASAGDWITTRSNARWLPIGKRGWVRNGQRWMIHAVERDGAAVRPLLGDGMATVRLPASYVREHTSRPAPARSTSRKASPRTPVMSSAAINSTASSFT